MDKEFFILYFVASDVLLSGRLVPCKWNQAWRPSELYMCIEREKDNFTSREVNCLKECALALTANFLFFHAFYSFSGDIHDDLDTEIFLSSVTFPYFRASVTLIHDLPTHRWVFKIMLWHKKRLSRSHLRGDLQDKRNTENIFFVRNFSVFPCVRDSHLWLSSVTYSHADDSSR